jgi:hypothetical protein
MPDIALTVTVTDAQATILERVATLKNTTTESILEAAAHDHALSVVATFRQDVINRIPQLLVKATEQEQAVLLAKFEEIAAR